MFLGYQPLFLPHLRQREGCSSADADKRWLALVGTGTYPCRTTRGEAWVPAQLIARIRLACVLAALLASLSACTARKKPSGIETALATAAKDIVIPIEAENTRNPVPNNAQVANEGKQIYLQ